MRAQLTLALCSVLRLVSSAAVNRRAETSPNGQQVFSGKATFNFWNGAMTACGLWGDDSQYITSVNSAQFGPLNNNAPICGQTITVAYGDREIQATVVDKSGQGYGEIDLSLKAFEVLQPSASGVAMVTWWFNDFDPGAAAAAPAPSPVQSTVVAAAPQPAVTDLVGSSAAGGIAAAGDSSSPPESAGACEKGQMRCSGNTYQICDIRDNVTKLGEWVDITACPTSCQMNGSVVSCV